MPNRSLTEIIPDYLRPYIATQDASLYTPMDHAAWRFILKISRKFLGEHAHEKYLHGLEDTGISSERIPLITEIDAKLRQFGWRAVAVSGFIPPAVFMEFQALGILPIACEMRTLDHLAYTPAPDIVHEAAGHAPILADAEYANYLRSYGEVARKAIYSSQDMAVYEAIRELSVVKEDPASTPAQIHTAEANLEKVTAAVTFTSEATYLARMFWWTVEYGLVGSLSEPKIYGAGLLSSVGESFTCLDPRLPKRLLDESCVQVSYDITRPQPQLFVTPDFPSLGQSLEKFASTMAFRKGGMEGLNKAQQAGTLTTTQLETGLQISGVVTEVQTDAHGQAVYVRYSGPCQLAVKDQELPGQGVARHQEGYSTPLGRVRVGTEWKPAAQLTKEDFTGTLVYESGIEVKGRLAQATLPHYVTLEDCTVRKGSQILYQPEWGPFDLALGTQVTSVFGGAADRPRYLAGVGGFTQAPRKPKTNLTAENRGLNELYALVRRERESGRPQPQVLAQVGKTLDAQYPRDWLLRFELWELGVPGVRPQLEQMGKQDSVVHGLLQRGFQA